MFAAQKPRRNRKIRLSSRQGAQPDDGQVVHLAVSSARGAAISSRRPQRRKRSIYSMSSSREVTPSLRLMFVLCESATDASSCCASASAARTRRRKRRSQTCSASHRATSAGSKSASSCTCGRRCSGRCSAENVQSGGSGQSRRFGRHFFVRHKIRCTPQKSRNTTRSTTTTLAPDGVSNT